MNSFDSPKGCNIGDWEGRCEWLSIAKFHYNNWVHASTQSSPFMLNTGQHPQLGMELLRESRLKTLNDFASRMEKLQMKHAWPSPEQLTTWPDSTMPIIEKHHYMRSGIKYGLMVRT